MKDIKITIKLNGEDFTGYTEPGESLLNFLRDHHFYDVKCGCAMGDCGTCTLLFNGKAVKSCLLLAAQADGGEVLTVKGLTAQDTVGIMLAEEFIACGSVQCGFCIPGMIAAGKHYIAEGGTADRKAIRRAISGNLCRCTGYNKIVDAIYNVAAQVNQ